MEWEKKRERRGIGAGRAGWKDEGTDGRETRARAHAHAHTQTRAHTQLRSGDMIWML